MEPNDDEPPPPPFWLPPTTTINHHRRRQPSSFFLNTGMLVILLLLTAIIFLLIVIPSVMSLSRQVFNPTSVKSSWNSLNVILVIFAIVCGFLSKKNDDQSPVNTPTRKEEEFEHNIDKLSFDDFRDLETIKRLRRSSSSYPDLRQEENVMSNEDKWRFYDDTDVNNQRFQRVESRNSRARSFRKIDEGELDRIEVKNIEVDTFVKKTREFEYDLGNSSESSSPSVIDDDESISKNIVADNDDVYVQPTSYYWPPSPPPPPPPPPPPRRGQSSNPTRKKTNQTFETIGHGRYKWKNTSEVTEVKSKVELATRRRRDQSSVSPEKKTNQTFETIGHGRYKWKNPPSEVIKEVKPKVEPPPKRLPPVVVAHYKENKQENKKKGGVNVITKEFFTSFYNQSKRKRKHKRNSYENLEPLIESPRVAAPIYRSKSTPEFPPSSPPPPLPSPHSAFHNIFSKKGKTKKKLHSPPPPPPPPPPPHKAKQPKGPMKNISFTRIDDDEISEIGNETPLRAIPPPPPPPPFKMKPWHFVVQGDYVKLKSNKNITTSGYSSSSSSEDEDEGSSSSSAIPLFSPSPDVNIKADDFIARFRAKLNHDTATATASSRLRLDSI